MRRECREVKIGNVIIGGGNPIAIQSMTTTPASDIEKTVEQVNRLYEAGADIVRFTVPDENSAKAVKKIKERTKAAIVADIHFDYRLALMCIDGGIDKIRINPGNIGSKERAAEVAKSAMRAGVPIRIGVNSGSLEKEFYEKYGSCPKAMVESAKYHASILEECGMSDIVISLKASDVRKTVEAYTLMAKECSYPLHLGVTEAGTAYGGIIKSSAGIGALLLNGIGDTIRVSLTADPIEEVKAAKALLSALDLRDEPQLVSCPTCGRCMIDLIPIAKEVEERLSKIHKPIKVAVMGCVVNGPGEAKEADVGMAGGKETGILFKKGELIKQVPMSDIVDELMKMIEEI